MIFTWTFTWCLYWIVTKGQINPLNVTGTVISAGTIVFLGFSKIRDISSKTAKFVTPHISKGIHLLRASVGSQTHKTIQLPPSSFTSQLQIPCLIPKKPAIKTITFAAQESSFEPIADDQNWQQRNGATENMERKISSPVVQEPVIESKRLPEEPKQSEQPKSMSNGCPKNLSYFNAKPKPKQTPEECFTCKNLISCVCRTSD